MNDSTFLAQNVEGVGCRPLVVVRGFGGQRPKVCNRRNRDRWTLAVRLTHGDLSGRLIDFDADRLDDGAPFGEFRFKGEEPSAT
jgi:hypothetical protein